MQKLPDGVLALQAISNVEVVALQCQNPQIRGKTRYWWMLLIRGIIAILFGLAVLVWPGLTAVALVYLFGAFALIARSS